MRLYIDHSRSLLLMLWTEQITSVLDVSNYSVIEALRDGRTLEIRAFTAEDRTEFLSAVDRIGPRSRYPASLP